MASHQQQEWDASWALAYQQAQWLMAWQQQQQQAQTAPANCFGLQQGSAAMASCCTSEAEAEGQFTDAEVTEFNELLFSERKVPPAKYVCYCCYEHGHYIYDCPKRFVADDTRTPYQGHKTSFGQFLCGYCKHRWNSPKSARDAPQKCNKCKVDVYPHKQFSMETAVQKGLYRPRPSDSRQSGSSSPLSMVSSLESGSDADVFARMANSQLF